MAKPQRHVATTVTLALIVASSMVGAGLGGGRAAAGTLSCGDTITTDTTLESDLIDCPNNGIVIGAGHITLDLNGHRIDGDGTEFGDCRRGEICDIGVLNDGYDGVQVLGGTLSEFAVGVVTFGARRNDVFRLDTVEHVFAGIILVDTARSRVRLNASARNTGPDSGVGIVLFASRGNRIAHNTLSGNREIGIHLDGSHGNRITRNDVHHAGGLEDGILVAGNENRIARNRLTRGSILITEQGVGNVVRANLVRGAPKGGIAVDQAPRLTILVGNHVFRAELHGILVGSPSTTLTRNEARYNGRLGIKAVEGVIDGGGNRASGNGDPRQCVNVSCSP